MKRIIIFIPLLTCLFTINISCKEYLDKVPDTKLAIPSTVNDMKLLLDNYTTMNTVFPNSMEIQADNYYVTSVHWTAISDERIRNQYIWQKTETTQWAPMYKAIFTANVVIDGLKTIEQKPSELASYNNILGSALFFKSYCYYLCAQTYGLPYDKATAATDLGIVLRFSSDFEEQSKRFSNSETYGEIINGFEQAIKLLPLRQDYKTRPTKSAAYGALSRTYLAMQDYIQAGKYADSCITSYGIDSLMNFNNPNDIDASLTTPIRTFNKEVIFHFIGPGNTILGTSRAKIDDQLYNSYDQNDLRRTIFFKANTGVNSGTYSVKGLYDGGLGGTTPNIFGGIALDEMYLIRAEASARAGNISSAMADLNKLLINRWLSGSFNPLTATDPNDALKQILMERRKELIYRGTRWVDLRRLMKDPDHSIIPKRSVNNNNYELPRNSSGYVLQIPSTVINLSGIPQNP